MQQYSFKILLRASVLLVLECVKAIGGIRRLREVKLVSVSRAEFSYNEAVSNLNQVKMLRDVQTAAFSAQYGAVSLYPHTPAHF